jgi:hypothetical protein
MLQESQDLFNKLKKSSQEEIIKKAKRKIILKQSIKKIVKYGSIILILAILIFPKQTGSVIGTWINNFFGTIAKESTK